MRFLGQTLRTGIFVTVRSNQAHCKVNRHCDNESYRVIRAAIIKVRCVLHGLKIGFNNP